MRKLAVGLLSCLVVVQVGLYAVDLGSPPLRVAIEVGKPLPFEVASITEDLTPPIISSGGCRVGFICSINCPFCSRLTRSFEGEINGLADGDPLWLIANPADSVRVWALELGLPLHSVFSLGVRDRTWLAAGTYGNIWMTPMRVILTPDGTVLDVRPSDELPDAATLAKICAP